jgi:hypothetical protein
MTKPQRCLPGVSVRIFAFRELDRQIGLGLERLVAKHQRAGRPVMSAQFNAPAPAEHKRSRTLHAVALSQPKKPRKRISLTKSQIIGRAREIIEKYEKQVGRGPSESYIFEWDEDTFNVWGSNGFRCFGIKERKDTRRERTDIETFINWLESCKTPEN